MKDQKNKNQERNIHHDVFPDSNRTTERSENLTQNTGGTTDAGTQPRGNEPGRATGSGLGSKSSVTGSDFDGQVA